MQPTDGKVTQPFGTFPQASGEPWPHTGADFAGNRGDTVRSIAPGTVAFAGLSEHTPDALADRLMLVRRSPNSGKCVIIEHDGWLSFSAHMDSITVTTGQKVSRGTRVGGVGNTGNSQGVHLHFECIRPPSPNTPPFGRYDPQLQIAHEDRTAAARPAASTPRPKEKTAPVNLFTQIKNHINAVLISGYRTGGKKYPGMAAVDIENQRRITVLDAKVDEILTILKAKG